MYRSVPMLLHRILQVGNVAFLLWAEVGVPRPVKVRLFFERAGGAFIKLGQLLALRHDYLPQAYTDELLTLLASVPVVPFEDMERVFVEDFGKSPHEVFAEFETTPVASASVGQVYRARLREGGTVVAVKIQRPGAREQFETDFLVAKLLGRILDLAPLPQAISATEIVEEFVMWTRKELDFMHEVRNGIELYENGKPYPQIVMPRMFEEYSTARVLVAEYLTDFVSIEAILRGGETGGINVERGAERFVVDIMRQYFVDGFFHADPHPANVFFMSGDRVGYFDFGLVGRVRSRRLDFLRVLYGIAKKDVRFAARYLVQVLGDVLRDEVKLFERMERPVEERVKRVLARIEGIMVDEMTRDLEEILIPWYASLDQMTGAVSSSSSVVFSKLLMRAAKFNIQIPGEIALFFRTLSIVDMVALRLSPRFDMLLAIDRFFDEYPLDEVEEVIRDAEAEHEHIEPEEILEQGLEELHEERVRDEERIAYAEERLTNFIERYADRYEELRKIT